MFSNIDQVKAAHRRSGGHFFDDDIRHSLRRCTSYKTFGGRFFISSEMPPDFSEPRNYTIQQAFTDGHIENVSAPGRYPYYAKAYSALKIRLKHV